MEAKESHFSKRNKKNAKYATWFYHREGTQGEEKNPLKILWGNKIQFYYSNKKPKWPDPNHSFSDVRARLDYAA